MNLEVPSMTSWLLIEDYTLLRRGAALKTVNMHSAASLCGLDIAPPEGTAGG